MKSSQEEQGSLALIYTYSRRIIPIIGVLITGFTLLFGNGVIRTLNQPRIFVTRNHLVFEGQVLNSCYVRNDGHAMAEQMIIQLNVAEAEPFTSNLEVYGAEGQWKTVRGKVGDNYARVELARLAPTHVITATVATTSPTQFDCQVSFQGGSVLPARSPFALSIYDYIALAIICLSVIIVANYIMLRMILARMNKNG